MRAESEAPMAKKSTQPIPAGYTTVTPGLCFKNTSRAIEFYKQAFGAEERERMLGPNGAIMHAEIKIGNSIVMMGDEMPGMNKSVQTLGGSPVAFYLYVTDADTAHRRALDAGAKEIQPVTDQFWGDRSGQVEDPFGLRWNLATRTVDMSPEEMRKAGEAWMKKMGGPQND
jgi:uncharacterized glyoxalase superfamily protein PhnB